MHPIYEFYAEMDGNSPKVWRRFQMMRNATVARLGYIVLVLFEMPANHSIVIEVPKSENYRNSIKRMSPYIARQYAQLDAANENVIMQYKIPKDALECFHSQSENVMAANAVKTLLQNAVSVVGDRINLIYGIESGRRVTLKLEKVFADKQLPGYELPRLIKGEGLCTDGKVAGMISLDSLDAQAKIKAGEKYKEIARKSRVKDSALSDLYIDDMNFRLKKIPRIYKQYYEDALEPTQASIDLIERKYLQSGIEISCVFSKEYLKTMEI